MAVVERADQAPAQRDQVRPPERVDDRAQDAAPVQAVQDFPAAGPEVQRFVKDHGITPRLLSTVYRIRHRIGYN